MAVTRAQPVPDERQPEAPPARAGDVPPGLGEPAALLALQRTAGNRAVAELVARQAPAAAPAPAAASPWWPDGPTVGRKSKDTPLADYVAWVREVEAAHPGREDVVKRLRRLYYSSATAAGPGRVNPGVAGPRFDQMIAGSPSSAPLTSPPVSLAALNGLFETDAIVTPGGDRIDPTHIFAMLDVSISGTTATGAAVESLGGVSLKGVFTWVGDLASWFVDWVAQKKKAPAGTDDIALLLSRVNSKVGLDDLLADMDAQAMAAAAVQTTHKTRTVRRAGEPMPETEMYDFKTFLNRPLSDLLEGYYGRKATPAAGAAPADDDRRRFALFVRSSVPRIPHTADPARPGEVKLASDAEDKLYEAIYATAEQLMEGSAILTRMGTPDELEDNPHVVREIARRFHRFLEKGLAAGSAPWP